MSCSVLQVILEGIALILAIAVQLGRGKLGAGQDWWYYYYLFFLAGLLMRWVSLTKSSPSTDDSTLHFIQHGGLCTQSCTLYTYALYSCWFQNFYNTDFVFRSSCTVAARRKNLDQWYSLSFPAPVFDHLQCNWALLCKRSKPGQWRRPKERERGFIIHKRIRTGG